MRWLILVLEVIGVALVWGGSALLVLLALTRAMEAM